MEQGIACFKLQMLAATALNMLLTHMWGSTFVTKGFSEDAHSFIK